MNGFVFRVIVTILALLLTVRIISTFQMIAFCLRRQSGFITFW